MAIRASFFCPRRPQQLWLEAALHTVDSQSGKYMPGDKVAIDFRKWPTKTHWQYPMEYLGEDEHGRWLWAPAGTVAYRGEEGPFIFETLRVKVVSREWWAANWYVDPVFGGPPEIYVDVISPAVWAPGRVVMVDLDLDVRDSGNGDVAILDEDEFLRNQIDLSYPAELIEGASLAAKKVFQSVVGREEPFGGVGLRWVETALAKPRGKP